MRMLFSKPPGARRRAAVFLDRDGVINEQVAGGYVTEWSQFRFVPGIRPALAQISGTGVPVIVVSNQAAVGKGLLDRDTLAGITRRFVRLLRKSNARIDAVYYCPHTPADGCTCRKPKPGLLIEAQRDWGIDLGRSVFLGDSATDAEAGRAAGCEVMLAPDEASLQLAWRWLAESGH